MTPRLLAYRAALVSLGETLNALEEAQAKPLGTWALIADLRNVRARLVAMILAMEKVEREVVR